MPARLIRKVQVFNDPVTRPDRTDTSGTGVDRSGWTKAASYVRMSTRGQRYSITNQMAVIERYAMDHLLELVRAYSDAGKSGLRIKNRDGLKQLIQDVVSGEANFTVLLVYDI